MPRLFFPLDGSARNKKCCGGPCLIQPLFLSLCCVITFLDLWCCAQQELMFLSPWCITKTQTIFPLRLFRSWQKVLWWSLLNSDLKIPMLRHDPPGSVVLFTAGAHVVTIIPAPSASFTPTIIPHRWSEIPLICKLVSPASSKQKTFSPFSANPYHQRLAKQRRTFFCFELADHLERIVVSLYFKLFQPICITRD